MPRGRFCKCTKCRRNREECKPKRKECCKPKQCRSAHKELLSYVVDCDRDTFVDVNLCRKDDDLVRMQGKALVMSKNLSTKCDPLKGEGKKMFYDACKAALRSGKVTGCDWDKHKRGFASFATGIDTVASGTASVAVGKKTQARGDYSFAEGLDVKADPKGVHIMGKYGKALNIPYSWQLAGGSDRCNRDITVVIKTVAGEGIVCADDFISCGADFSEYGEWYDGNTQNADRVGYFVATIDSDYTDIGSPPSQGQFGALDVATQQGLIAPAKNNDEVYGIISGTPTITGDAAEIRWHDKLLRDKFRRPISYPSMEQGVVAVAVEAGIDETEAASAYAEAVFDAPTLQAIADDITIDMIDPNSSDPEADLVAVQQLTINSEPAQTSVQSLATIYNTSFGGSKPTVLLMVARVIVHITKPEVAQRIFSRFAQVFGGALSFNTVQSVEVAIVNPDYDASVEYIPRSQRPEWDVVGLLGKIIVRDNGIVKKGDRVDCENAIAVPGTKWKVVERVSEDSIRIIFG